MAAIALANVSYSTIAPRRKTEGNDRDDIVDVSFGDGVLTYPAGGVPLSAVKLGMPNFLRSLEMVSPGSANGFLYKYDSTNKKIRIFQQDGTTGALTELSGAATPAAATLRVHVYGW